MRSCPLLLLLALGADILPAQQSAATRAAAALSADVLRGHLEFLADDALEGRAPGTRGGELAQKYIASQFRRLGLEPAGDSGTYYQRVPIISLTPTPTLAVTAPAPDAAEVEGRLRPLVDAQRYQRAGPRATRCSWVTESWRRRWGWNDYAGLDAKGKIVVALVNDPGSRTRPSSGARSSPTTAAGPTRSRRPAGRVPPAC